jgi:hypothetical protein
MLQSDVKNESSLILFSKKKVLLYVSRGLLLLFHKKNKAMNEREVLLEAKYMFL